jgi:protein subunit release factor B
MKEMTISLEKEAALRQRMTSLGVREEEFRETFIRSSGPGGQKVNKTSSCVHLVHLPTGLSVKCQQERSQTLNRFLARRLLLDRIERLRTGLVAAERMRVEKVRRNGADPGGRRRRL